MGRILISVFALVAGLILAAVVPSIPRAVRSVAGLPVGPAVAAGPTTPAPKADAHGHKEETGHGEEGKIVMTSDQVEAAGIKVAVVGPGVLVSRLAVPGILAANQDRLARVTARVGGTIAEVRKGLGEQVAKGDVLVVIESREIADAKGEYLAASRSAALAEATLARETRLWKARISPEQDLLQARTAAEEVRIRVDLARQKLSALGLSEEEVADLPKQPVAALRRLEIRAPIKGQVTARSAILGAAVGSDAELFTVADLSTLWVEMAIPPRDLAMARQGQAVTIDGDGPPKGQGRIVFVSPTLDPETRSARGVAELANGEGNWRPGGFVVANLATAEQRVEALVPRGSVQEIEGVKIVFVRTPDGFEKREVAFGREDADGFEAIFGVEAGTEIAVDNAFALKAELSKSEAGHAH